MGHKKLPLFLFASVKKDINGHNMNKGPKNPSYSNRTAHLLNRIQSSKYADCPSFPITYICIKIILAFVLLFDINPKLFCPAVKFSLPRSCSIAISSLV